MDLYAITIRRPDGDGMRYRTMWKFTTSPSTLRAKILRKIEHTNWQLHLFHYERQAYPFEEYYEKKKYKKVLTKYNKSDTIK